MCASLHDGLHSPSLTSHTLELAPTTAESHTGAAPPTGVWASTRTLHREAAEGRHLQPPGPGAHPPR